MLSSKGNQGRGVAALLLSSALVGCGGDAGTDGGGSHSSDFDACAIVTEADATALFGQPAKPDEGNLVVDPAFLGQCNWTYEETDQSTGAVYSQSLFFHAWDSPDYNAPLPDADPLDVGSDGWAKVSEAAGVSIGWVQDDRSFSLGYFSIGPTMPTNASQLEPMKALAGEVSGRL
jgi:hypothetical protein